MGSSLKDLTKAEVVLTREAMNYNPHPEVQQCASAIHLLHQKHKPAEVDRLIGHKGAMVIGNPVEDLR